MGRATRFSRERSGMRARHHLTLVLALLLAGCGGGSDSFVQTGDPLPSEPTGDVQFQFVLAQGEVPAEAESFDLDFLQDGNTIHSRDEIPKSSTILVQGVPVRSDEVHVWARADGRVVAESYLPLALAEGETTVVEAAVVARSCRAPGGVAKELINQLNLVTVISGGDQAISDEDWETYEPSPPFSKNSDRHLEFVDSCFYRSFSETWECQGEDCYTFVPHDGYSWLRLAQTEHVETYPLSDNTDRVPPPGFVQVIILDKCQELVFEGQIWEMHDPWGNVYVMHANPDGEPDPDGPTLPEGWHIETRVLDEPLVLNPRGQNCRYTLIKDDQDQAYHQYAFDGLDGLAAAVTPQCAELLDEN